MAKRRKPDPPSPLPFGYKIGWFAVASDDTDAVIRAFMLRDAEPCNWATGVTAAYADKVFVTPPVGGWTLLPAWHWVGLLDRDPARVIGPTLRAVSKSLSRVHFFATYRVVGYHLWAEARNGRLVRAFCHCEGETVWDAGKPTQTESDVGPFTRDNWPDEESVMQVAAGWSINPCELKPSPAVGTLGLLCSPPAELT